MSKRTLSAGSNHYLMRCNGKTTVRAFLKGIMAEISLIVGSVPFMRGRKSDGKYLYPGSFKSICGSVPVCWGHWLNEDYVFTNQAAWLKAADGLFFIHTLDLTQPRELEVYRFAQLGSVRLSYGFLSEPEEVRKSVARYENWIERAGEPAWKNAPLKNERIGHWAYTFNPNFNQEPVQSIVTF
jgi:hypothetical protein